MGEPSEAEMEWGREYLMVEPTHFRVDYAINPFMDTAVQPDAVRARDQWQALVETLRGLGAPVSVLPQRPDAPDMVYAMNLGLGFDAPVAPAPKLAAAGLTQPSRPTLPGLRPVSWARRERRVVLSHMRYEQRRLESDTAHDWFSSNGWTPVYVGRGGVGAHFEAGDAFPFGDALVVGFGPRTDELALKHLATELGLRVRGLRITHPGMYHLDLAFCPLDERRALVCPDAFDADSAAALLELVPEPLVLTEEEALSTFCANSVVVGRTVVMPGCPDRVRRQLEAWGFNVALVDVSEFHLGGGSVRCLTNPLDITLGRDLPLLPGGEVLLP